MIVFRGSQEAVLDRLLEFLTDDSFRREHQVLARARQGIEDIRAGGWLVIFGGWAFEVVEPPVTVEQDVYGCPKGRSCTSVPARQRPMLDAMIKARRADGRGTDDRFFHWYWTLDRRLKRPEAVRSFVTETLGSPIVADAAQVLYAAISEVSACNETDVHVTLLPDRMRLRVDYEGGWGWNGDPEQLPKALGSDGRPVDVAKLLTQRAQRWGVVGYSADEGLGVWADFARTPGDEAQLAASYVEVPADEIPSGAYLYWGLDRMAWVRVASVDSTHGGVYADTADGQSFKALSARNLVPIFKPDDRDL